MTKANQTVALTERQKEILAFANRINETLVKCIEGLKELDKINDEMGTYTEEEMVPMRKLPEVEEMVKNYYKLERLFR